LTHIYTLSSAPHNQQTINILKQLHPKRLTDNNLSTNDANVHDITDVSDDYLDCSTANVADILDGLSSVPLQSIDLDINIIGHKIISYRKMVSSGPIPWRAEHL
jgi:hypothetical protein